MPTRLFWHFTLSLTIFFLWVPDVKAVPYYVTSEVLPNNLNNDTSDLKVSWKTEYQTGDILETSDDGIIWKTVDQITYGEALIKAVPNWSVIHFRVRDAQNQIFEFKAFPPNINVHADFQNNTDLCAKCHLTHSATQIYLLREWSIKQLCNTCHGGANTGSRYNTDNGAVISAGVKDEVYGKVYNPTWQRSLAGPLASNSMNVWPGPVTSSHYVNPSNSADAGVIPPAGINHPKDQNCRRCHGLTCISCHRGHYYSNSYRMLYTIQEVYNNGTWEFFTGPPIQGYAVNGTGNAPEVGNYVYGMNVFCENCHGLLAKPEGSGSTPELYAMKYNQPRNWYRHSSGVDLTYTPTERKMPVTLTTTLPTEGTPGRVFCLSCHYAHGTTVTYKVYTHWPNQGGTTGTMLKRTEDFVGCMDCHKEEAGLN